MWKSGMWICTLIVPAIPAAAALAGETVCACTADTSIASSPGFEGPVATARLKAKRRAEQDIELMNMLATQPGWNRNRVARAVAAAVNLTSSTEAQGADDPGRTSFECVHAADLAKIRYALTQEILAYSGQQQRVPCRRAFQLDRHRSDRSGTAGHRFSSPDGWPAQASLVRGGLGRRDVAIIEACANQTEDEPAYHVRGMVTPDRKMIYWAGDNCEELYDMTADVPDAANLAADPRYVDDRQKLLRRMFEQEILLQSKSTWPITCY